MKYNFYLIFLLIFLSSCTSNHIYKTDVDIQNKIQSLVNKNPNATTEELIKNCLKDLK